MDQFYFEEGYIEASYLVYIAEAKIDFGPYIESNYIDILYFDERGSWATVAAELTEVFGSVVEASGSWTSAFTQSATATKIIEFAVSISDAFTPTVTANVTKNQVAILTTAAQLTVDAVANRAASVTLSTIANLNAQAAKTAGGQSSVSAQATVTANILSVQLAQATISSTAALTASGIISNRRPRFYTKTGSADFTQSLSKFGTGSLFIPSGNAGTNYVEVPDSADWTTRTWKTIDFWAYIPDANQINCVVDQYESSTKLWEFRIQGFGTGNINRVAFVVVDGANVGQAEATVTLAAGSWRHFRFIDSGSAYAIFVDGTRRALSTNSYYSTSVNVASPLYIGRGQNNRSQGFYVDELLITKDQLSLTTDASFTPPTTRWYPEDQTNILILSHYDTDLSDDLGLAKLATATVTSTATVSAQVTSVKAGQSSQSAQFSQTVEAVKTTDVISNQSSTVSQTTDIDRFRSVESTQTSDFAVTAIAAKTTDVDSTQSSVSSITATGSRIKQFSIDITDAFTPTVNAVAQLAGFALLESQATVTASANYIVDNSADLNTASEITVIGTQNIGIVADLTASVSQTTDNVRVRYMVSSLSTTAQISADSIRVRSFDSTQEFTATITASVLKLKRANAVLNSAFTVPDVKTQHKHNVIASLDQAVFTQTTEGQRIRFAVSDQNSTVTVTAQAVKTPGISAQLNAEATVASTPVKTVSAVISAGSLFTPNFTAVAQLAGLATLTTASTVTVTPGFRIELDPITNSINYGVSSYDIGRYPRLQAVFTGGDLRPDDNGFTLSIWARRDSIGTTELQPMISTDSNNFAWAWQGSSVILRQNFDPDEPNPTWSNVNSDTDWHHYLFYTTWKSALTRSGLTTFYRLWVDGVYQGERTYTAYNESVVIDSGDYIKFGQALLADTAFPYTQDFVSTQGGFAQLWIGYNTSTAPDYNPPVDYYYDGHYQDLFEDGRGLDDRLPQPKIYNSLSEPYTGIEFLGGYDTDQRSADPAITRGLVSYAQIRGKTEGVFLYGANLSAQAQTTVTVTRIQSTTVNLASTAQTQAQINGVFGAESEITATVTVTAQAQRLRDPGVSISGQAQIFVTAGFEQQAQASLSSEFLSSAQSTIILPIQGEAQLSASVTMSIDADSFTDSITLMASAGSVTCDVTVIPPIRASADLTVTATVSVIIGSIEQFAILTASSGSVTVTATRIQPGSVGLQSNLTLQAQIGKITGFNIALSGLYSTVTVGDVINIDPFLTLIIEPETRALKILEESRQLIIEQETRSLIIEGWE